MPYLPFAPAPTPLYQVSKTVNALGDSISARGINYPSSAVSNAPAWLPSTAYVVGNCVLNSGNLYACTAAGTSASSGGPTGTSLNIQDNTAYWEFIAPTVVKYENSYLMWAEAFSLGALKFDMFQGYAGTLAGLLKGFVVNGGSNYTAPTVTLTGGATATLQTSNGVITGITITNPGQNPTVSYTISDSTGSGAVLSLVLNPAGTFGVAGTTTTDMVARLPDVVVSKADIICVLGGTNDLTANATYATITGNLATIYQALIAANKKVIAIPILPRTGLTNAQLLIGQQVNRWIYDFVNKVASVNTQNKTIAIADPCHYWQKGDVSNQPYGGSGGTAGAMTYDGLHPSPRGAMYMGYAVWQAALMFSNNQLPSSLYQNNYADGHDFVINPGGNLIEAPPWAASTAYVVGQFATNGVNIYRCKGAGTSASSGGPTGTGSTITDGTTTWAYDVPAGASVFASGTAGTTTAATGVVYSGNLASNYTLYRNTGSASGTVTLAIENPWSNNQYGQRQSMVFSLGSGTAVDTWSLNILNSSLAGLGIPTSDLGAAYYQIFAEIELSSVANLNQLQLELTDGTNASFLAVAGSDISTVGAGSHLLSSTGEVLAYPNSGRIQLRTQPILLPANMLNLKGILSFSFDTSGGAGSATCTFKLNKFSINKVSI